MNDLKLQLKRQLIANIIKDKCKHCEHIFFDESLCTQDRVIRFSTGLTSYEVENNADSLTIRCKAKTWQISKDDADALLEAFVHFLSKTLPKYEKSVQSKYIEGEKESIISTKYERNPKARAACLAYHGTACIICGIDFEKAYGPEFAGKIEVHHIVPISEIGEEYVVDPIHDLLPVCPNCHTAIHSKKDGVYSIEEMQALHNKQ